MKHILNLAVAISCTASPLAALAGSPVLLRTFNNPPPSVGDNFGAWLSPLGGDRLLIGAPHDDTSAPNGGAVYLYHTNGTLMRTLANPAPAYTPLGGFANRDQFGAVLAALGADRIMAGVTCTPFLSHRLLPH